MTAATELSRALAGTRPVDPLAGVPLLACRVCHGPLDAFHLDIGTHPTCDPEPQPWSAPASTLRELAGVLRHYIANDARSLQVAIGPSQIAVPCDRRLGYSVRGVPEQPDDSVLWAPFQGTATHAAVAAALRLDNERLGRVRWLVEERVWPDPQISGSCDCYDTDTDTVIDWKLVGVTTLKSARSKGASRQYRGQIQIYGRGWQRAGKCPRTVRIVYLARTASFDDSYEWSAPYSRVEADAAMDRMYAISTLLGDLGVDESPALWGAVPASPGRECRFCPYYRRGRPADETGCPGDVAADERREARFADGLIPAGPER